MLNFLTTTATGDMTMSLLLIVGMFAIIYFVGIRPENKKKKADEAMRAAMRTGDSVTTIGGIVGTVVDIKEDKVVIETSADRVRIEFLKNAIGSNETQSARAEAEAKKAKEAAAKAKAVKKAEK